jgi:hypothetical protein
MVREKDLRALRGKAFHDGAANATRASGDQHHLSCEFGVHKCAN